MFTMELDTSDLKFELANKVRTCPVQTGTLRIVRVPGLGLQGIHKPHEGRQQVLVPCGKVRLTVDMEAALIAAWRDYVGLDNIHSYV